MKWDGFLAQSIIGKFNYYVVPMVFKGWVMQGESVRGFSPNGEYPKMHDWSVVSNIQN